MRGGCFLASPSTLFRRKNSRFCALRTQNRLFFLSRCRDSRYMPGNPDVIFIAQFSARGLSTSWGPAKAGPFFLLARGAFVPDLAADGRAVDGMTGIAAGAASAHTRGRERSPSGFSPLPFGAIRSCKNGAVFSACKGRGRFRPDDGRARRRWHDRHGRRGCFCAYLGKGGHPPDSLHFPLARYDPAKAGPFCRLQGAQARRTWWRTGAPSMA